MRKRFFAALLAAAMLAGSLSVSALADGSVHSHDVSPTCGGDSPVDFTRWDAADSLPDQAGCYYLSADVTLHGTWAVPEGTLRLCLNGHSVTGSGADSVIALGQGAVLDLCDCQGTSAITGGGGEAGGGIYLDGGSLNLYGGSVTGNEAEQGGGVYAALGSMALFGAPVISDNTGGNLCLGSSAALVLSSLTDGARIGVSLAEYPADGSAVAFTGTCSDDFSAFLTSDHAGWEVACGEGNVLLLRPKASVAQGQCGAGEEDTVSWNLSGAGVLTLSGTGAMADYQSAQSSYAPWRPYREDIRRVVVEQGVTALGDQAFCNDHSALAGVTLPEGLIRIGDFAFGGCTALETADFPASLTTLGKSAFSGCTTLREVSIPATLTDIGDSAFSGCTTLETAAFEEGVTTVSWGGFWGCTGLKEVVLPASVTAVKANAFHDCPSLATVRYGGTKAQWTTLSAAFASGNDALRSAASILCSDGTITNAPSVSGGFVIRFDANGGEGSMSGVRMDAGSRYNLPTCSFTPPSGQRFKCWSVDGAQTAPGTRITVEKDLTVLAVWETIPPSVITQVSVNGVSAPVVGAKVAPATLTVTTTPQVSVENYTQQYLQLRADRSEVLARFEKGQITETDRDESLAFLDGLLDQLKQSPADDRLGLVAFWADPETGRPVTGAFAKKNYVLALYCGNLSQGAAVSFGETLGVKQGKKDMAPAGEDGMGWSVGADGCLTVRLQYTAAYPSSGGGGGGGDGGSSAPAPAPDTGVANGPTGETSGADWSNPFDDVAESAWYYDDVAFCHAKGLMSGIAASSFAPGDTLSRAMLAQILYNKEGRPAADEAGAFSDLEAGAWYENAVNWAAEKGIVEGYADGRFGPGDSITREQLAVMLWRYAGRPATDRMDHLAGFSDRETVSGYAETAMQWAVAKGILNGKEGGQLDPLGTATRSETAAMLRRFVSGQTK